MSEEHIKVADVHLKNFHGFAEDTEQCLKMFEEHN